jgi:hypothetical protein
VNMATIYCSESILKKWPEFWITVEMMWKWSSHCQQVHILAVEWLRGKNEKNSSEVAVNVVHHETLKCLQAI